MYLDPTTSVLCSLLVREWKDYLREVGHAEHMKHIYFYAWHKSESQRDQAQEIILDLSRQKDDLHQEIIALRTKNDELCRKNDELCRHVLIMQLHGDPTSWLSCLPLATVLRITELAL